MDALDPESETEQRLRRLFLAAQAGDAAPYQQFLGDLSRHLRAYFRRRLHQCPDDVEDLVQEALLAIHRQRHTYRPAEPLTAWIHGIARYKLIDFLRAHARRDALHDPLDDEGELLAAAEDEAVHARRDIERMLGTLPERQRQAVEMVKLAGASVAETARATGQSEAAVKVGVHRSIKALAARFGGGA